MIALIIAQVILIASLLFYNKYMGSLPASISDSYYELNERKQGRGHLFTFFCWLIAMLIMPVWLTASREALEFLAFLSCAGMLFAGTAAEFQSGKMDKRVHFISAFTGAGGSLIWLLLSGFWYVIVAMLIAALFMIKKYGNKILWLEVAAIEAVILGVFIHKLLI